MSVLEVKVAQLRTLLREMGEVVICFSGGVDSSYLLAQSIEVLGKRATALTAVSPSLAPEEGAGAKQLADQLGARHILVETNEVDDPRYAANPVNRCYFCKTFRDSWLAQRQSTVGSFEPGLGLSKRWRRRPCLRSC